MATGFFISEYVEGSGNNKAIELFNNTGGTLDLSDYVVGRISNGGTDVEATISLSGTLADGETFVIVNSSADAALLALADLTSGTLSHNGDDHLILLSGGSSIAGGATIVDMIGTPDSGSGFVDPGSFWQSGANDTQNNTLRRNSDVTAGAQDGFGSDLSRLGSEWTSFSEDTFDGLGSHSVDGSGGGGDPVDPIDPDPTPEPLTLVINEILADPASDLSGDANGDDTRDFNDDEFVEIVNTGAAPVDMSGMTLSDAVAVRHVFADGTTLGAGEAIVVFGGGTPTGDFGGAQVVTASTGALGLNNSGDTVTLASNPLGGVTVTVTTPFPGSSDQSLTRGPDLTGPLTDHSTADTADASLFSPGTRIDGTPFVAPAPAIVINEFSASTAGTDVEYVELFAAPGTDLSGLSVLQIEGEIAGGAGTIDSVTTGFGTADANGLALASLASNTLENGALTLLLVEGFTGAAGDDLDTDDDGTLDAMPWTRVLDGVSVDRLGTELSYSGTVLTEAFDDGRADSGFAPGAASRITDGTDTDSARDWFRNDFSPDNSSVEDGEALNTPGALNQIGTGAVTFAVQDATITEGDSGTTQATITVLLNGAIGDGTQSVDVTITDGTATSPADYTAGNATLTFAAGETSKTVTVDVVGDALVEGNEDVTITLSNPAGGALAAGFESATLTIADDDAPVVVTPTLISAIQGATDTSPLVGQTVTVEAIVVGDFQDGNADGSRDLRGFFLQEEDADADGDALTSEGLFVFDGSAPGVDVNVGDLVQVTGTVDEFFGQTQLDTITSVTVLSQGNALPTAASVTLPAAGTTLSQDGDVQPDLEAFEGMLVSFADTLTVTEMFQLDRFNEIKLVAGDRPYQFTQQNAPDVAGYAAHLQEVGARTITYDDGLNQQNAPIGNLDGFGPTFSSATDIRMGDTIDSLTGVLDYQWAGNSASGATWRVRSTENGENNFDKVAERPAAPEAIDGSLKIASFNVLNYFATIDTSGATTANGNDPRGADTAAEFARQTEKLVTAITAMDADILGLIEMENDFLAGSPGNAIETLVAELNAVTAPGAWAWVDPGVRHVGDDAIANGFIYRTDTVGLAAGTTVEILDDSDLPGLGITPAGNGIFDTNGISGGVNRPVVTATFEELASGETFTAAVNHFKSKGSLNSTSSANEDAGDGAGRNNGIRLEASIALSAWLATDPTGSGDPDFLILGDLNSYAMEDPITALIAAGYTDLVQDFIGPDAYGYVFDGQVGTLDYAMANAALAAQVAGVTEWRVNSDEPDAIDYNTDFGRDPAIFDGTIPARNSDHDPVIVGLDLGADPVKLVGRADDDSLVGAGGDDRIVLAEGDDSGTGNGGADTFVFDARKVNPGEVHSVTDLDFSEGDRLLFRFFDEKRVVDSAEDLAFYTDNGFVTVTGTNPDGSLAITVQNLDQNFGSDNETFIGTGADDLFDGGLGDDRFVLRFGDDAATGGGGADTFILDARYVGEGSVHTVTDLDFAEGDRLLLRRFDARNVSIDSLDDLDALAGESYAGVTDLGGDDRLLTLTDGDGGSLEVWIYADVAAFA